ncbi:unnamed protein product [Rhodiola kirilowii]
MAERDFGAGDEEAEDLIGCGLHEALYKFIGTKV